MLTRGAWFVAVCGAALAVVAPAGGAAPTTDGFVDGRGSAAASVVAVVPEVGQARLPITVGLATAAYGGRTGTAEATTAQLGLLGTVLTLSICGGDPILRPDQLPAALHTDSIEGENRRHRDVAAVGLAVAGSEAVTARPDAFASSEASPARFELPGVLSVSGRASAEAELVPGDHRRAGAVSELATVDIAGGLVRLEGLRWAVEQRTDADGSVVEATGAFSVASLVIGGVPLAAGDASQLRAAVDAANVVLEPLLGRIDLPSTSVDQAGTVTVSPLSIRVSGGSITSSLLTPLLGDGAGSQLRQALADALLFGGCKPGVRGTVLQQLGGAATTVLDVVIASMLGGGGVSLELGGARATTDATTVGSAFGPPAALAPVAAPATDAAPAGRVAARPGTTPLPAPATHDVAPEPRSEPAAARLVRCITSHPSGDPGCRVGRGALAAGLGTAALAALVGAELVHNRRRRRADP